ncbi:MAG: CRISPR-associated endonuclease Cas1 [Nitrososphaerales archaeon]
MRLVVNEPGLFVGTRGGMITVQKKGERVVEVPVAKVDAVVVLTRGASFSSALMRLLSKHNVPLVFYSSHGLPLLVCRGLTAGSVMLRKKQYEAQGKVVGLKLAKLFAAGKMFNQSSLLYSMARNREVSDPPLAKLLHEAVRSVRSVLRRLEELCCEDGADKVREEILRLEAEAARVYWDGVRQALLKVVDFPGRRKRFEDPSDPVNVSLNYLYRVLAGECYLNVEICGLDPYAGFLHTDSPRRPALVMDLMEEFRQQVVDRVVFRLAFERKLSDVLEGRWLKRDARMILYRAFAERLNTSVTFSERSLPISEHMLLQTRRVAEHIMGRFEYVPFTL